MTDFEIESVIRLHTQDAVLEVGSDPDTGHLVELRTPDKRSKDWYGDIRLALEPEMAEALAYALMQVAKDLRNSTKSIFPPGEE